MAAYPVSVAFTKGFTPAAEAKVTTTTLKYLQTQQSAANGSIPLGASTDSVSEEYAIGAAAAGYDPKALRHGSGPSVMTYLSTQAGSACASAGACGLLIQAVVAAHLNPSSFGGVNLITTLNAMYKAGVYGDGEAFTESLAIQGLVAAGQTVPTAAVHHLVAAQDSDGGWDYLLIKDDPNGSTNYDTSDTNSTSMVLMALNAAGTRSRNASALAWLHTQQDGDGGFPYQAGAGTDPDSTALVLQALAATGQNPEASAWAPGGNSPARRADRHPGRRRWLHLPGQLRTRRLHHRPGPTRTGARTLSTRLRPCPLLHHRDEVVGRGGLRSPGTPHCRRNRPARRPLLT